MNWKQILNPVIFIILILFVSDHDWPIWWAILAFNVYVLFNYRHWIINYCKEWMEDYKAIMNGNKNGKK